MNASQKKFPEAAKRLEKVIEKNDKNVGAHVLLGMVINSEPTRRRKPWRG